MLYRLTRVYVISLLSLGSLLFVAGLALHILTLASPKQSMVEFCRTFWFASIFLMIPSAAFIKDGLRWLPQLRSCPPWLWRTSLGIWIYGIIIVILEIAFPAQSSPVEEPIVMSGFPLGFIAITLGELYASLWRDYFDESGLRRRFWQSLFAVGVMVAIFVIPRLLHQAR